MIFKGFFCQVGEVKGHQEPRQRTPLGDGTLSSLQSLAQFKRTSGKEQTQPPATWKVQAALRDRRDALATAPAAAWLLKQLFSQQPNSSEVPPLRFYGGWGMLLEKRWPQRNHGPVWGAATTPKNYK